MRVIKLGGSLADKDILKDWLDSLAGSRGAGTVIVPGGGGFADQVRNAHNRWCFNERTAHIMALLAMQQMACMYQGINQQLSVASSCLTLQKALEQGRAVVWSPDISWLAASDIPESWDITSDSIAAWLTGQLAAEELILVKAAPVSGAMTIAEMAEAGIVDAGFPAMTRNVSYAISVVNGLEMNLSKYEQV